MKLYDENEAIDFICKEIQDLCQLDKDTILDILDLLYDFYDENGCLDIDFDDDNGDEEEDIDAAISYISKHVDIDMDTIRKVVSAEMLYQDSLL